MAKTKVNIGVAIRAREDLELTPAQMGEILGLNPVSAVSAVLNYEASREVGNGSALRVYESLFRCREEASRWLGVPRWTVGAGPRPNLIHHNEWPRFVAVAFETDLHAEQWRFRKSEMPILLLDEKTGFKQLVVSFVDHVPMDYEFEDVLEEAVRVLEKAILGAGDKKNA